MSLIFGSWMLTLFSIFRWDESLEKMSHFWNDSLPNLNEPNQDTWALSHSSISRKKHSVSGHSH